MPLTSPLPHLKGRRCVIVALLSARVPDPDTILGEMESAVQTAGGTVVGRMVQRRGASRSKRRGGSNRMDQPLTQRTLLGTGKTAELAILAESTKADAVLMYNGLTPRQRRALNEFTGCEVFSLQTDGTSSRSLPSLEG